MVHDKREKDSWCITVINYVTVRVSNIDHVDAYLCSYNMKYTGVIKSGLPLVEPISCVINTLMYLFQWVYGRIMKTIFVRKNIAEVWKAIKIECMDITM